MTTATTPAFHDLSPRQQDGIFAEFLATYGLDWVSELEDGGLSTNWLTKWRHFKAEAIAKLVDRAQPYSPPTLPPRGEDFAAGHASEDDRGDEYATTQRADRFEQE